MSFTVLSSSRMGAMASLRKRSSLILCMAVLGAGSAVAQQPRPAGPMTLPAFSLPQTDRSAECNAECLRGISDTYLTAFEKHDPNGLPLAANFIASENSHVIRLGENAWRTVVKVRPQRATFTDPYAGQVVTLGTLEMNAGEPFIYVLRLKVENKRITESEMQLTSTNNSPQHFNPDNVVNLDPVLARVEPAAERSTRQQLLDFGRAFWVTGEFRSAADCLHTENADRQTGQTGPGTGCPAVGGPNGFLGMFSGYRGVRHAVADVERGVVVTFVNLDSTPRPRTIPAGERTPPFYQRPMTFYMINFIKIEKGVPVRDAQFYNFQEANAPLVFVD